MMYFITSNRTLLKVQLAQKNSKSINPLKKGSDSTRYNLSKPLESNPGQLHIEGQFCLCINTQPFSWFFFHSANSALFY
jgi:hypothetical protein